MKRLLLFVLAFTLATAISYGEQNEKYLKDYVQIGLKNNLELKGSREGLKAYDARLGQAIAGYLPRAELTSRYTRAGGGRSFVFPLGQMMNPLYEIAGLSTRFKDENVPFMRPEEQDTKLEIIQPVFNMAIWHNIEAQDKQIDFGKYEYQAKELATVYNIKEAYYNYAKAMQLVSIRKYAETLVRENYETAKKLYNVDKVPKTDVLRAEVALSQMTQELQTATNNLKLAGNVFNNFLNQESNTPILFDSVSVENISNSSNIEALKTKMQIDEALNLAITTRPEISQMEKSIETIQSAKSAISSDYYPSLAVVFDYGVQGEKYKFDKDADYWMLSGVFKWNLFTGLETKNKVQEIEAQASALQYTKESTKKLIKLDVMNNYLSLQSAFEQLETARKSYAASAENYDLNKKRYAEGLNSFISLLDAETTLNSSKEFYIITYYEILTAKAKLEKSMGLAIY